MSSYSTLSREPSSGVDDLRDDRKAFHRSPWVAVAQSSLFQKHARYSGTMSCIRPVSALI